MKDNSRARIFIYFFYSLAKKENIKKIITSERKNKKNKFMNYLIVYGADKVLKF